MDICTSQPIAEEKYTVLNIHKSFESILPFAVLYLISNVDICVVLILGPDARPNVVMPVLAFWTLSVEPIAVRKPRLAVERLVVLILGPDAKPNVVVPVLAFWTLRVEPVAVKKPRFVVERFTVLIL